MLVATFDGADASVGLFASPFGAVSISCVQHEIGPQCTRHKARNAYPLSLFLSRRIFDTYIYIGDAVMLWLCGSDVDVMRNNNNNNKCVHSRSILPESARDNPPKKFAKTKSSAKLFYAAA